MLTDSDRGATDRAARNEYLIDIDEAWEACREAVEGARSSYEEELDLGRVLFEEQQATAANEHSSELDKAWESYKQAVSNTPSENRRQVISEARATYNETAAALRQAFDEAMSAAHAAYAEATETVRLSYEATVDAALAAHREAIQSVRKFMEPAEDKGIDYLGLASELAARVSNGKAEESENLEDEIDRIEVEAEAESVLSSLN
ncbi:MAG TPA: hypothetical protein VEH29_01445 [Acidimicrobiales bacterium]|nr:hypothetical protein [Acidimicrobiales bacterium]